MNLRKSSGQGEGTQTFSSGGSKRLLIAGGVVAGVAAVAAMSVLVLSGGDSADEKFVSTARPTATSTSTAAPTVTPTAPAIDKYVGKAARDPFKALVEQVAATGSGAGTGTAAGTGTTGTTSPLVTPVPSVPSSTSTTPSKPTSSPTRAPTAPKPVKITLVTVNKGDTLATFRLDAKTHAAIKPLGRFGTYFKLLTLREGRCGTVQYGDVVFDLCEGDSLTLR